MEQNQMNYEEAVTRNYPEVIINDPPQESKLPLISTIFSGLTLIVAIAILVITLVGQMARPTGINRIGGAEMFQGGERPNFEMNEGERPAGQQ